MTAPASVYETLKAWDAMPVVEIYRDVPIRRWDRGPGPAVYIAAGYGERSLEAIRALVDQALALQLRKEAWALKKAKEEAKAKAKAKGAATLAGDEAA